MNQFYTYVLINSLDHQPIYIGQGHNDRYSYHLKAAVNNSHYNKHLQRKIQKILSNNGTIIESVFNVESEQEAKQIEVSWIKQSNRMGVKLCNKTDGGDGGNTYKYLTDEQLNDAKSKLSKLHKGKSLSAEHKRKISEAKKGVPCPEWQKEHLSKLNTGKESAFKGCHHSDDSKLAMSQKRKGSTLKEETKIKISNKLKGVNKPQRSSEHIKRISEALKGRKRSIESIEKQKEAIRQKKLLIHPN